MREKGREGKRKRRRKREIRERKKWRIIYK
jgi:hypothetical protein